MLLAYADESSDETKTRVFAIAAVVGSPEQWEALEKGWVKRTEGVPFHANDCESNRGAFSGNGNAQNKQLYADLVRMLASSGMGGYGLAIDISAQREVFPENADMSYYKAFQEVVEHLKNCAEYNKEVVRFTFDQREESRYNSHLLFTMLSQIKDWEPFISGELTFDRAIDNPRLQVADLFVREVMKCWDNKVGPVKRSVRKSWNCLRETERFHADVLSLEWFNSLKEDMPKLEKHAGMSMESYAEWLRAQRLSADNISNRLAYIRSLEENDRRK